MCTDCNNRRSQPFDRAQESFNAYLRLHEQALWRTKEVDFREIFGPSWSNPASDVLRFWIKHVACRLAEHDFQVLPELLQALDGAAWVDGLSFQLVTRRDLIQLTKFFRRRGEDFPYIAIGDLDGFSDGSGITTRIESSLTYGWFEVRWAYDLTTIGRTPIVFNGPTFEFGTAYRVHPLLVRARVEMLSVLKRDS